MGAIMKQLIFAAPNIIISDHNWYFTTRMSCLSSLFMGAKMY